jgi:hypothetical protein
MPPVRYELGLYISEDGIHHSHRREKPQILHPFRTVRVGSSPESKCAAKGPYTEPTIPKM